MTFLGLSAAALFVLFIIVNFFVSRRARRRLSAEDRARLDREILNDSIW